MKLRYWDLFYVGSFKKNNDDVYFYFKTNNEKIWFTNYNLRINNFCRFKYEYSFINMQKNKHIKSYFICG